MTAEGFQVETTRDLRSLAAACNLIVTTTSAREPLLQEGDVRPGTHITAMGADAPGKQELDPRLVARADVMAADSLSPSAGLDPARLPGLTWFVDSGLSRTTIRW